MEFLKIFSEYHEKLQMLSESSVRIDIEELRLRIIDQKIGNLNLENKDVDFAALVRSNLKDVKFSKCHVNSSLFFEDHLSNVSFLNSTLCEAQIRDSKLEQVIIKECDLSKVQLSDNVFKDSKFIGLNMAWSSLSRVTFENCQLENIDFTGATINDLQFVNCTIKNCKSIGDYKISLIDYPKGKIGESEDLLDLISAE